MSMALILAFAALLLLTLLALLWSRWPGWLKGVLVVAVTVLYFWGHEAVHAIWGLPATGAITNWVPLIAFAFLYGLSMDYEVFILTRIREEHDRTGSTTTGVINGIARTGRLVTSAALILFLAFVALSRIPTTDVKILATGLALGIVLDATIVRGVLAPALVAALGPANWWWPGRRRRG